jgi:adenosylcobinamide kinase/adenosylcobinamide-phosphate guanylyltransferase
MSKLILVTGGARSGKSGFAERYAAKLGGKIAYIATAEIYDEEMAARIRLHRASRPSFWQTYEAPFEAAKAIDEAAKEHDTILFDCLTVYASNQLLKAEEKSRAARFDKVMADISEVINAALKSERNIIFVTNEVGAGIVPENALAREYRDLAGKINQKFAKAAAEVYMVISGIAVNIKNLSVEL